MSHTPEPWQFHMAHSGYPGDSSRIIGQDRTMAHMPTPGNRKEEAEFLDNFRRIVACVNACAGIPTEDLEGVNAGEILALSVRLLQTQPELQAQILARLKESMNG